MEIGTHTVRCAETGADIYAEHRAELFAEHRAVIRAETAIDCGRNKAQSLKLCQFDTIMLH
jgi:hypothetical protein